MTFSVRKATGFIRWYLRRTGFWAITIPVIIPGVYILPEFWHHKGLRDHEAVHVKQIETLGAWTFLFKYLAYQLYYGYEKNPLEIEARKQAGF